MDFPRLALGAIDRRADSTIASLALMLACRRRGLQIQHFHSAACFSRLNVGPSATGSESRHLDSWLMPAGVCRELFARNAALVDLSIIEGHLSDPSSDPTYDDAPGRACLWQLADHLEAPVVAVVRAGPAETFHIPRISGALDGVVIDGVASPREFRALATMLTGAWKAPVLGAVEPLSEVRQRLAALPPGSKPSPCLCEPLADSFSRYARFEAIEKLAASRPFPDYEENLFGLRLRRGQVKVAVALDEAFDCYFPDTLDLLDCLGAQVVDFSPLHDDRLPDGADIIYFGCGHPERHAASLGRNECMISSLKDHVFSGGRVYGESGGLAYLCQHLCLPDGSRYPMAGVLPAIAHLCKCPPAPRPVEVVTGRENWLSPVGQRMSGYLNSTWRLEPTGPLPSCLGQGEGQLDLVSHYHAIGSRLHLNFAAQPRIFRSFLCPHAPALR